MESLGGINTKEYYDNENAYCIVKDYVIKVDESIIKYLNIYEAMIKQVISKNL